MKPGLRFCTFPALLTAKRTVTHIFSSSFSIILSPANPRDFSKCRREIAASLNDFSNRWCKRENVEPDALKEWKINIFKIIDTRISFYSRNTHLLPPKPKSSFRHLKRGIQDFHMNYVLVPADKAANNVVVV